MHEIRVIPRRPPWPVEALCPQIAKSPVTLYKKYRVLEKQRITERTQSLHSLERTTSPACLKPEQDRDPQQNENTIILHLVADK